MVKETAQSKVKSVFGMVNVADLNIDPDAQRSLSQAWVKAHIQDFDVDQLGFIVVNKRTSGKIFVVDGQHRVELLRAVGWGDQKIHAEIFNGLSQSEEADLFLARNDRKAVSPLSKFLVAVTAGDPIACDINRIVRENGLVIANRPGDGHIMAVDALIKLYKGSGVASQKEGAHALDVALKVAVQAWGRQSSSVNGKVLQAIGMVHLRYNGLIDQKILVSKLAPFPGGAPSLLGKGRAMQELRGRPIHHCIAALVVDVYNKGRRDTKLDSWES